MKRISICDNDVGLRPDVPHGAVHAAGSSDRDFRNWDVPSAPAHVGNRCPRPTCRVSHVSRTTSASRLLPAGSLTADRRGDPIPTVRGSTRRVNEPTFPRNAKAPHSLADPRRAESAPPARRTKKNSKSYDGYTNHLGVDNALKLIRTSVAPDACAADNQQFDAVPDAGNTGRDRGERRRHRQAPPHPPARDTQSSAPGGARG